MKPLVLSLFISFCAFSTETPSEEYNELEYKISDTIEAYLSSYQIPGVVALVGNSKGVEFHKAFGAKNDKEKLLKNSVFDLASITKVFTAAALLKELEARSLGHNAFIQDVLSEYERASVADYTFDELLRHESGHRAGVGPAPYNNPSRAWDFILNMDPQHERGVFRYSDVNYLILGKALEGLTGQRLDQAIKENVLIPFKMTKSSFLPRTNIKNCQEICVPTKRGEQPGLAHDPTSRKLGGVAGHAGLFSSAGDLSRFATAFLNGGKLENKQVISFETAQAMTVKKKASPRGLGFDISSPYSDRPRGDFFSEGISFGHTGFTGTSLWIDPVLDVYLIVLSNPTYAKDWKKAKKGYLKLIEELANIVGRAKTL